MRRDFLPGTIVVRRQTALHLQAQFVQLLFQRGNLLLLTGNRAIQLFQQVFAEAQLDFDFSNARIHDNSRNLLALFAHYNDLHAVALHGLASTDFCGFAAFRPAINSDFTISHHVFALATAVGNAGEFEQIAKPDMFILQLKLAGFHGFPDFSLLLMLKHDTGSRPGER
jgi:hypothetical protein